MSHSVCKVHGSERELGSRVKKKKKIYQKKMYKVTRIFFIFLFFIHSSRRFAREPDEKRRVARGKARKRVWLSSVNTSPALLTLIPMKRDSWLRPIKS